MRFPSSMLKRLPCAALLFFLLPAACVFAQQPTPTPQELPPDDVLRINTELVQTDVMVFDKGGRFVDNLQREQFELRVDGKPQAISFFDRVTAGSASEEAQLAAARGVPRPAQEQNQASVGVSGRGRIVVFFIDDLHMTFISLQRAKKTLLQFINNEMGQNDQVAVASTSGQIGFLQQLTDNKTVLRLAVERLDLRPQQMADPQRPPMSEYLAQAVIIRRDPDVLNYYVEALIKDGAPPNQDSLERMVMSRAQQILDQSSAITRNTLFSLDSLARTIGPLPGRKLVFFISDGFLLNTNESDINAKFSSITNVAARNGVVIYTMDARGLVTDPSMDASQPSATDHTGRIQSALFGEITASQEGLRRLADNTGGRALLNSNALDAAITKTLKETSTYYIIAWRPETEGQKSDKLRRIELKIAGRPDLRVQVKRGFLPPSKEQAAKSTAAVDADKTRPQSKPKTPADELRAAVSSFYTLNKLPTVLALDYVDSAQAGAMLTISLQIPADALSFDTVEGKHKATVDIGGSVYNDKGQVGANFGERLGVTVDSLDPEHQQQRPVYYSSQVRLSPGLYQVRAAARDAKSGRIGNATQWIEIPDLKTRRLALSSLLVGETTQKDTANTEEGAAKTNNSAKLNVARRFARASRLRFLTFIYNASRGTSGTAAPDIAIQVQVLRDDQPVLTTALRKVATEGLTDLARIPYAAEILLDKMPPGGYVLRVTTIDRVAKASASQQLRFTVE